MQKYCVSDLAAALKNITLQQEPADPLAAVTTDAGLLQEPTEETRTRAVTVEMGKRALRYSYTPTSFQLKCKSDNRISLLHTLFPIPFDCVFPFVL